MPICAVRIARLHHSGETRERCAETKHERVEQLDVDAERPDHFAVGSAGADQHSDPCPHDEEVKERGHEQCDDNDR